MLIGTCSHLLEAAQGGSILIKDVEAMAPAVQNVLIDVLMQLQFARTPPADARLILGTTVSLLGRIASGSFSQQLFYRLNVIHILVREGGDVASS